MSYLRGGEKMGSNYFVNKEAYVAREPAIQGNVNKREVVPQLTRLQLCDEVKDQDRPLTCGGPLSGQQDEEPNMRNVE